MATNMLLKTFSVAALAFAAVAASAQTSDTPVLTINVDKPITKVSPTLYGLMTEEINYSYDGGLYAELVRNRTFRPGNGGADRWYSVHKGNSLLSLQPDKTTGPSEALPNSLKVVVDQADAQSQAGIENGGYWGIPLRPNTVYQGSFYAKAADASIGAVTVRLVNDDSGEVVAQAIVPAVTSNWASYDFPLKTGAIRPSSLNHLEVTVAHPGTIWFNLVSLFPPTYNNRVNGNRIDLMEKMAAMKPAFLRFPGGNYLEGDHIPERYQWKKTIGPLVDRPTHPSPWRYQSSDGMGLLEFLEWCEDLHMQPLLAVYAGYSMAQEHVDAGPNLEPYVQDALEEIEYVTGSTSTKWGAERAKDGHPAPFKLSYVEVGNEDWFDRSGSYSARYAQFYHAIKTVYPDLQIIATAQVKGIKPDVVDDHFYKRADQFFADVHHYDNIDRNGPKIFVGEWATREGSPTPNFGAALGDAAWMTGMERNSDLIVMASYAPLFVNVNPGGMQWESDLIGYDAMSSYGSPSYYAQVMFSNHLGDEVLGSTFEGGGPRLFYSITRDSKTGRLFLKIVNASSAPQPIEIKLTGTTSLKNIGTLTTLSAKTLEATNTIQAPTKIVPVTVRLPKVSTDFNHTLPAYSIQIMDLDTK